MSPPALRRLSAEVPMHSCAAPHPFSDVLDLESRPPRYRLALDMDDNGFDGRFCRVLASRSAPFKITIFREWHDERLPPWVHYVPVSVGLEEFSELVQVLILTAAGRRSSKIIAEARREWHQRAMAPKQQGIYVAQDRSLEAG